MSFEQLVEAHHKLQFTGNVKLRAQQLNNPFRAAVTEMSATGEAQDAADLIGTLEYIEGEDRSRRNVENVPKRDRRWLVRPLEIKSGQYIETVDKFDLAMDPTSRLMETHLKAVNRGFQDRILGVKPIGGNKFEIGGSGILGKVTEGKRPSSNKALPGGNYIPHGGVGLTIQKLRAATEAMELNDFGLETDDEIFAAISPPQKTDLLNLALESKVNLNAFELKQIETGQPTTLLGITWIFTNRLPHDDDGKRLIPLWSKENVVCGVFEDINGRIWNDGANDNLPYIKVQAYPDCTRLEDVGIRVIECAES